MYANADGLFTTGNTLHHCGGQYTIGQIQALPVTTKQVHTATRQDRILN